eukprot:scaffold8298_cov166-Amphora_coffeaeformis.AAC.3
MRSVEEYRTHCRLKGRSIEDLARFWEIKRDQEQVGPVAALFLNIVGYDVKNHPTPRFDAPSQRDVVSQN